MKSLSRAMRQGTDSGRPLPTIWPSLERRGGNFNRGEVSMIGGQSAAGKSQIAQWHAVQWIVQHGVGGLYFSADGRKLAVASRVCGMLLGEPVHEMKTRLAQGDKELDRTLARTEGLEWCFESEVSLDLISQEFYAYEEKWGKFPEVAILDNLIDLAEADGPDQWNALGRGVRYMNQLAGETDAHVMVLHHTSEAVKEEPCPPKSALHGKISAKPTMILTTAQAENDKKPVAVVKTRETDHDKSGRTAAFIHLDGESMVFRDLEGY